MNIIKTNWNWAGGLSGRARTDYIALHHAAAVTCTAAQVDQWHKSNGWSGIGYHYFVRKDGSIYEGRPLNSMGAHVSGMNNCSIGICAEGNYDIETSMPDAQYDAILSLISYLHDIYPDAKVVGHKDIGSSDCPGKYYPLNSLKIGSKKESEGFTMTQYEELKQLITLKDDIINTIGKEVSEGKNENAKLKARIEKLENPMIYDYIDKNMPQWAHESVQWCVNNGLITGTGDGLGLNNTKLWVCVVLHRAIKYIAKLINVKV